MSHNIHPWLTVLICFALATPASAIVRRHDVADSAYTSAADAHDNAVWINCPTGFCTGTLIAPDWVLTAAHCVDTLMQGQFGQVNIGNGSAFPTGQFAWGVSDVVVHPSWDGDFEDAFDLALIQLDSSVTILPIDRHNGTVASLVSQSVSHVGYGNTGAGNTGGEGVGTSGTKRAATNVIDRQGGALGSSYSSSLILTDFDGPASNDSNRWGSGTPTSREANLAHGDSGGPWIVAGLLAGVSSFISDDYADNLYGEYSAATAVAPHNDWINSVMGGVNWNNRTTVGYVPFNTASAWGDGRLPASTHDVQFSLPYVAPILYGAPYIGLTQNQTVRNVTVEFGPHTFHMATYSFNTSQDVTVDSDGTMGVEGGTLNVGRYLFVGYDGEGTFNHRAGTTNATLEISVGRHVGSNGLLSLSGGSIASQRDMVLGYSGTGIAEVTGGSVTVSRDFYIGLESTGEGEYLNSGGTLNVQRFLFAGYRGTGIFTQSAGNTTATVEITVGRHDGSDGTLSLSGGTLASQDDMVVGYGGTGVAEVTGGSVNVAQGLYLGFDSTGDGTFRVEGSGTVQVASTLNIGYNGDGEFIQEGGEVSFDTGQVARFTGSEGRFEISGGTLTASSILNVGTAGNGSLTVSGTANANIASLRVGRLVGGVGQVHQLQGTVTVTEDLSVGNEGTGTYRLDGGSLNVNRDLFVSQHSGSVGEFVQNGGSVAVGRDLLLPGPTADGTYRLRGGVLDVSSGQISLGAGSTFEFTGGTLHVGTFNGDLVNGNINSGGVLSPGNSVGQTTINGSYTQESTGTLQIDIECSSEGCDFDRIDVAGVTGNASLAGLIDVSVFGNSLPALGQQFPVLTASNITNNGLVLGGSAASMFNLVVDATSVVLHAIAPVVPGDYNGDGYVDAADYIVWQKNPGGIYTPDDYDEWRTNFGRSPGSGIPPDFASTVPEPTCFLFAVLGVCLGVCRRMSHR